MDKEIFLKIIKMLQFSNNIKTTEGEVEALYMFMCLHNESEEYVFTNLSIFLIYMSLSKKNLYGRLPSFSDFLNELKDIAVPSEFDFIENPDYIKQRKELDEFLHNRLVFLKKNNDIYKTFSDMQKQAVQYVGKKFEGINNDDLFACINLKYAGLQFFDKLADEASFKTIKKQNDSYRMLLEKFRRYTGISRQPNTVAIENKTAGAPWL